MSTAEKGNQEPERASVSIVFCRQENVTKNVTTVVVPQIKRQHVVVHAREGAKQIVFLSQAMKVTSLQRDMAQMFPASYLPKIEEKITEVEEGGIFHDADRFYTIMSKPDKKLLVKKIQQIVAYLALSPHLCPSRHLFYVSNGDPSWDAGSFVNKLRDDFQITHYVCATTKNLPVAEDASKYYPTKDGKLREVKAQSRGERGFQRRYNPDDTFVTLNIGEIELEIEAEEIKRKFKEQKSQPQRRHYHTKKAPGSEEEITDGDPATSSTQDSTATRSKGKPARARSTKREANVSAKPGPSTTKTRKKTPVSSGAGKDVSKPTVDPHQIERPTRGRRAKPSPAIRDLCENPEAGASTQQPEHLCENPEPIPSTKQPTEPTALSEPPRGPPAKKRPRTMNDEPISTEAGETEQRTIDPAEQTTTQPHTSDAEQSTVRRPNPPPFYRSKNAFETYTKICALSALPAYAGFQATWPDNINSDLPLIWIAEGDDPPEGYFNPGEKKLVNPPPEKAPAPNTPSDEEDPGNVCEMASVAPSTSAEQISEEESSVTLTYENDDPATPLSSATALTDPPSTTTLQTQVGIAQLERLRKTSVRRRLLDDKAAYLRLKAEERLKGKENKRGN